MRSAAPAMMLTRGPASWHHLTLSSVEQSAASTPQPHGPRTTPSHSRQRTCTPGLEPGLGCRPATPGGAWARGTRRLYTGFSRALGVVFLLTVAAVSLALSVKAARAQSHAPAAEGASLADRIQFFRWLEDYTDVTEAQRAESLYARLKHIPLASGELYPYLSLGGNYRFRYEYVSNGIFGLASTAESAVGLQRFLGHADLHVNESLRAFVQLGAYVENGRPGGPQPPDESAPDLQQAFIDVKFGPALIRLGRQELIIGPGLFTDVREGPNQRRSFDAVHGIFRLAQATPIDVFYGREVIPDKRAFRDSPVDGAQFWGLYGSNVLHIGKSAVFDLYYLGLDRDGSVYNAGPGEEKRHTVGGRVYGGRGAWSYDYQAVFQFGTFDAQSSQDIRAWALMLANYYQFQHIPWQPRVGLRANIASGDSNPRDGKLETFDPLFPNPSYLSEVPILYPRNLYELHSVMDVTPHKTVHLNTGVNFLWRFSRQDAVYFVPGFPIASGQTSDSRYIGYIIDMTLQWLVTPHVLFQFSYAHLGAGHVIHDLGGTDTDSFVVSFEARF